jgi:hypothetical protein
MVFPNKTLLRLAAAKLTLCLGVGSIQASNLYRYKNEQGTTVMTRNLPAKYAKNGYDVIDKHGRVIQTVERQLTAEEFAQKSKTVNLAKQQQAAKEAQEAYDISLLKRFSFVSDIEAEQTRRVEELKTRITILNSNLKAVRQEVDAEYLKAANLERSNRKVGELIQGRIQQLEQQILSTEALLDKHQNDIVELNKEYERDIRRFKELLALRFKGQTGNAH